MSRPSSRYVIWRPTLLATFAVVCLQCALFADDPWWSFQPLSRPPVPDGRLGDGRKPQHPIDAFITAQHRELELTLSEEADASTLVKRLYIDITGLPPSREAVEAFVSDADPNAYSRLTDRLLASPHYGERWARHWLDVVHYGETHGYDKDKPRPHAYPYRDYVIRSFNEDKPYPRFVQEQLAGDVLYADTVDGIEATGFIAAGPWDFIGHAEVPEDKIDGKIARHLDRDDMVATTMNTFCSLTVQCAQCHDHKRDPVTMTDYYALQTVFAGLDRADREYDDDPNITRQRLSLRARIKELEKAESPERASELTTRREALQQLPAPRKVYAGTVHTGSGSFIGRGHVDGAPRPIHLLHRGDVTQPRALVVPGAVPGIVRDLPVKFALLEDHTEGDRRVALAQWITHSENTLTWRSIVNRVWHYHFGQGIVATPNDFGRIGELPSHPALLDWLAVEFRDRGGSIKSLHQWILNSAVYKQRSDHRADAALIDSANAYLWRQQRRRLEAEALRDRILAVSGRLNLEMHGPSFMDFAIEKPEHSPHYQYDQYDPSDPKTHRRTIYRFLVRSQPQPFMDTLDCADPSQLVEKRGETNTALQALAMLNNPFVVRMAEHFAERIAETDDPVGQAYCLALSRDATSEERNSLGNYTRAHGLAAMCRLLFNLNEFTYVD